MSNYPFLSQLTKTRKFTGEDIAWLITFAIIIILSKAIIYFPINTPKFVKLCFEFCIPLAVLLVINSTPFGNRFSNFKFSGIWLLLSLLFIVDSVTPLVYYPLFDFGLFQVLRYLFWKKYDCEFIPSNIHRNFVFDQYNEIEGRTNDDDDKRYMKKLLWWGIVIWSIWFGLLLIIGITSHGGNFNMK